MKVAKVLESKTITSFAKEDLQRMRSFEEMLACNILAAEEALEAAKKRHYIFCMILKKFEEQNQNVI
jgi:hypothetical protein